MRRFTASLLCMALLLLGAPVPSGAAGDKELQNVKGSVSYQLPSATIQSVAPKGTVTLQDAAYAITGHNSLGNIDLPDSSTVLMGSDSKVQLGFFNQTDIANAKFVIYQGKVRFSIQHPKGLKANYVFQTPTAQIAVRGTVGDILASNNGMQVNVYAVSNPSLPVQVTLANGQAFTLAAGQSLTVTATGAAISASVSAVTQSSFAPFSELGAPANASSLGISAASTAGTAGAAAGTAAGTAATTGAIIAHAALTILGSFVVNTAVHTITNITHKAPTGPPAPTTTSVPVVIH